MERITHVMQKHAKLGRFIVTGGSAALVEYAFFALLHGLGLHILLSNSLSFMCGLVVSFSMNKLWVFKSRSRTSTQFGLYFVLAVINLCISDTLIWLSVNKLSLRPLFAKLIAMVLVAIWNYIIYGKIIFAHRPTPENI